MCLNYYVNVKILIRQIENLYQRRYSRKTTKKKPELFCLLYARVGFPCGSAGKESACNVGDLGLIPGLGRSPGVGKGHPLQYSGLENAMDYIVHGVTKSRI